MLSISRLKRDLCGFLGSRSGNIAMISAVLMPVLVGFGGLGAETAYWYYRQREVQGAADIAAYGGAVVLRGGANSSQITSAATADAVTNGWRQAIGAIQVHSPPTSGSYQNAYSVEVILTENQPRFFTQVLVSSPSTVQIYGRSTATFTTSGPACILGLSKNKNRTVEFEGNATANFNGCHVASNSSNPTGFYQGGSSTVTTPCVYSSGGSASTSGLHLTQCPQVYEDYPPTVDPYANVAGPTVPPSASCTNSPGPGLSGALSPGCFNGMNFANNSVVLAPGTYIINGGSFSANAGANIIGAGVTFYLTNGATLNINGGAHLELTAPTSGSLSGLLFFGDRTQSNANNNLNGNASSLMTGAVYFPSQQVTFNGSFTGVNGCLQVIADVVVYTGDGQFTNDCTGTGVQAAVTPGAIALVE